MLIRMPTIFGFLSVIFIVTNNGVHCFQRFAEQPKYTEVNPGQDALLTCKIIDKRGTCSWQKDNKPMGIYAKKYEWAARPSSSGLHLDLQPPPHIDGDCSLWIRSATLDFDDGLWECQVTASDFTTQDALTSQPVRLVVRVAPQRPRLEHEGSHVPPGHNITVDSGSVATVKCVSHYGNPPATLKWFLGDQEISPLGPQVNSTEPDNPRTWSASSVVQVPALRERHGQTLKCMAFHESYIATSATVDARLDVKYAPTIRLIGSPSIDVEEDKDALILRCVADANPPASIVWRRAGRSEIASMHESLQLRPVGRRDAGLYTCQAQNSVGTSEQLSVQLDVKYPPKILSAGPDRLTTAPLFSPAAFECVAEGNPPPTYKWVQRISHGSKFLERGNDARLVIDNVTYDYQGEYECRATSYINGHERTVTSESISLQVVGAPQVLRLNPSMHTVSVKRGDSASLTMVVCADPRPHHVAWEWGSLRLEAGAGVDNRYRADEVIQDTREDCYLATLHITNADEHDARPYYLVVENERGTDRHAIHLSVEEPLEMSYLLGVAGGCMAAIFILICLCIYAIKGKKCCFKGSSGYKSSDKDSEKADLKSRSDSTSGPQGDSIYTTPAGFHHHHPGHGSPEAMKNLVTDEEIVANAAIDGSQQKHSSSFSSSRSSSNSENGDNANTLILNDDNPSTDRDDNKPLADDDDTDVDTKLLLRNLSVNNPFYRFNKKSQSCSNLGGNSLKPLDSRKTKSEAALRGGDPIVIRFSRKVEKPFVVVSQLEVDNDSTVITNPFSIFHDSESPVSAVRKVHVRPMKKHRSERSIRKVPESKQAAEHHYLYGMPVCRFERQDFGEHAQTEETEEKRKLFQNLSLRKLHKRDGPVPHLKKLKITYPNRTQSVHNIKASDEVCNGKGGRYFEKLHLKTKQGLQKIKEKCRNLKHSSADDCNRDLRDDSFRFISRPLNVVSYVENEGKEKKFLYKSYKSELDLTKNIHYLDAYLQENYGDEPVAQSVGRAAGTKLRKHMEAPRAHKRSKSYSKPVKIGETAYDTAGTLPISGKLKTDKVARSMTTSSSISSSDYASVFSGPSVEGPPTPTNLRYEHPEISEFFFEKLAHQNQEKNLDDEGFQSIWYQQQNDDRNCLIYDTGQEKSIQYESYLDHFSKAKVSPTHVYYSHRNDLSSTKVLMEEESAAPRKPYHDFYDPNYDDADSINLLSIPTATVAAPKQPKTSLSRRGYPHPQHPQPRTSTNSSSISTSSSSNSSTSQKLKQLPQISPQKLPYSAQPHYSHNRRNSTTSNTSDSFDNFIAIRNDSGYNSKLKRTYQPHTAPSISLKYNLTKNHYSGNSGYSHQPQYGSEVGGKARAAARFTDERDTFILEYEC